MKSENRPVDDISPTFCSAPWVQSTIYLQNGFTHSCCHTPMHSINLEELKHNPSALHNTKTKKLVRRFMKEGVRPKGCEYCWTIEDSKTEESSERYKKSLNEEWSLPFFPEITALNTSKDYNPRYLELSFSNICNLRCAYCSPVLSSSWEQEIKKYGPYPDSNSTGDLERISEAGMIKSFDVNPYIEAFWKWWPELKKDLVHLRLTGGEPLLHKSTWNIFDSIISDPQKDLSLCINSNLAVPDKVINELVSKLNQLHGKCKEVSIITSCDGFGKQAEYIRYGLDFDAFINNIKLVLNEVKEVKVAVTITLNVLALSSLDQLVLTLLNLRELYPRRMNFNFSYLRSPGYLSFEIGTSELKESWRTKLESFFQSYQDKMDMSEKRDFRLLLYKLKHADAEYIQTHQAGPLQSKRADFTKFFKEYDRRKGTNLLEVFPEISPLFVADR